MSTTTKPRNGDWLEISNDEYHSGPGFSSSVIKAMGKSPFHCWANYLDPERPEREDKPQFAFGTAFHTAVLEPDDFDASYCVMPKFDKRTTKGKEAFAEWQADHGHKKALTQDDCNLILAMREAVYKHDHAAAMLINDDAQVEKSGYWQDEETGLLLKFRPDCWLPNCIIDLKSCQDASHDGFIRAVHNFDYVGSAVHYLMGNEAVHGTSHHNFAFIAVEKTYPHSVAVYTLPQEWLDTAKQRWRVYLNQMARCLESGHWPDLNAGCAVELQPTQWMMK